MPKQQASVLRYCSSLQILLFYMYYTDQEAEKAILVGVALQSEGITYEQMTEYLDELSFLAETAGAETVKIFTQNLDKPVHATFIGKGKLEEIKAYTEENPVDMVIFDDELSPTQLRNIESVFPGIKVLDRTNLILDIFASRARTAHAKTQVELAQYQYLLPRLTGMWTHLERQKGGIGLRGPGETEIETDRRIIRDKISRLKNELTKIDKQKVIQRKNRGKLVRVALVGYTNVGKSTLMKMIAGWVKPDSGTIEIGQTVKLGYFSQENEDMDTSLKVIDYIKNVAEYVKTKDGSISASQMLERFLFTPDMQYAPIGKLSGGEKRRLYLLGVLQQGPNVLVMDEVTNELDIPTLTILEDYLNSFIGIVILVSHDRYFLDNVADRIFAFDGNGHFRQYEGGYTEYLDAKNRETGSSIRI